MMKNGPTPTVNTFNCYLHGILQNDVARPGKVNSLLACMKERGLEPDAVTYSSMILFYLRQGEEGLLAAVRPALLLLVFC